MASHKGSLYYLLTGVLKIFHSSELLELKNKQAIVLFFVVADIKTPSRQIHYLSLVTLFYFNNNIYNLLTGQSESGNT